MSNSSRRGGMVIHWILLAGCVSNARGPYAELKGEDRNPLEAQQRTMDAVEVLDSNPARAEALLREALSLDLYHGPAHNNLGVLFLRKDKLYEAANEFEWARKLMPGHPDPRLNLALTLERAGQFDEALRIYATALEVAPEHVPTIQALASLLLRTGRTHEQMPKYFDIIALRGETKEWRDWALAEKAKASY